MKKRFLMLIILIISFLFSIISCKKSEKTEDRKGPLLKENRKVIDENTIEEYFLSNFIWLMDDSQIFKGPDKNSEVVIINDNIKCMEYNCKRYLIDNEKKIQVWYRVNIDKKLYGWASSEKSIRHIAEIYNYQYGVIEIPEGLKIDSSMAEFEKNIYYQYRLAVFNSERISKVVELPEKYYEIRDISIEKYFIDEYQQDYVEFMLIEFYNIIPMGKPGRQKRYAYYHLDSKNIIAEEFLSWWGELSGENLPDLFLNYNNQEVKDSSYRITYVYNNTLKEATGTVNVFYDFDIGQEKFSFNKIESDLKKKDGSLAALDQVEIDAILNKF